MSWDDINSYSYTKKHGAQDWGWEFIRRDSRYREEWERALAEFYIGASRKQILMFALLADDVSSYSDSSIFMNGTVNLSNPDEIDEFCIPSSGAEKWGLRCYQNPKSSKLNSKAILPTRNLHISSEMACDQNSVSVSANANTMIAVIDLKKPLPDQFKELEVMAKNLQDEITKENSKSVRKRSEKVSQKDINLWISYLRLLDAKGSGAKRAIAAPLIFSGALPTPEKKWDDVSRQIEKISKQNYRQFMG